MKRTSVQTRKQTIRRLQLRRETIGVLGDAALERVIGGDEPICNTGLRSGCPGLDIDGGAGPTR